MTVIALLTCTRQQTIDAHQSRIKQLQDTFLVQIKEAGRLEVLRLSKNFAVSLTDIVKAEKAEAQVKRIMTAEKDAAIKEWTRQLREEFSTQEAKFKEDLKQAKNQFEEAKRHQVTQETAWQMKCNLLIEQYKKTQVGSLSTMKMIQSKTNMLGL